MQGKAQGGLKSKSYVPCRRGETHRDFLVPRGIGDGTSDQFDAVVLSNPFRHLKFYLSHLTD